MLAKNVRREGMWPWSPRVIQHKTAIFRQVNQNKKHVHHDALEFPDGQIVLLTLLYGGQRATVLQLPAAPDKPNQKEEPAVRGALDWADPVG